MIIRKAISRDLKSIDEIYISGASDEIKLHYSKQEAKKLINDFKKYKKDRLSGFKKSLNSKFTSFIVAEVDKEIVGFGEAEINESYPKIGTITMIYILKKYRGKGIGSNLMTSLLKWLKNMKVKEVNAGVLLSNKPSIGLNKKFGFKINSVKMVKVLK